MSGELKHSTVGTACTQTEFEDPALHILDGQAAGDVIYAQSASVLERLAAGTAGFFLKTRGSTAIPMWDEVAATLISSKTKSASRDMTAASGAVSYTGVGFAPRTYSLSAQHGNGLDRSQSYVDSAGGVSSIYSYNGNTVGGGDASNVIYAQTAGGTLQQASHTSLDADGVTVTYTKTGSPTGTLYLAFLFLR